MKLKCVEGSPFQVTTEINTFIEKYEEQGYVVLSKMVENLKNGLVFSVVWMKKRLKWYQRYF